jgi:hypothetical protein
MEIDRHFFMTAPQHQVDGSHYAFRSQPLGGFVRRLLHHSPAPSVYLKHAGVRISAQQGMFQDLSAGVERMGRALHIGFSGGYQSEIHLHMPELANQHGFFFDSAQMLLNVVDARFNSFGRGVLPILVKENIKILGMKMMGDKSILRNKTTTPVECLKFSMNPPASVCITSCDSMEILQQGLDVVRNFKLLTNEEITSIWPKPKSPLRTSDFRSLCLAPSIVAKPRSAGF